MLLFDLIHPLQFSWNKMWNRTIAIKSLQWETVDKDSLGAVSIDLKMKMKTVNFKMSFWQALASISNSDLMLFFFFPLFSDSRFLINTWYNIAWRKPEQINETTQWCLGGHTGVWEDLNFGCNYQQSACLEDVKAGILFCKPMLQLLCCYIPGISISMLHCETVSFFCPVLP